MTTDPPTVPPVTWPYFPDTANALLDAEAPNLHLYLVADVGAGRGQIGYVGVDRDRAHDYARNTGGVVARLPVVGDYRTGGDPMTATTTYWRDETGQLWSKHPDGTLTAVCAISGVYESLKELAADVGPLTQVDQAAVDTYVAGVRFI